MLCDMQEDASEAEGEGLQNCSQTGCVQRPGQQREDKKYDEVNEMRMLRWMCGVTRRDKIRKEHIRGTTRVHGASVQENYGKKTEVVRPCEENERGAHSEKNVRC